MKRTTGHNNVIKILMLAALLAAGPAVSAAQAPIEVGELKIGRIDDRFAVLLPMQSATETHDVEGHGSFSIYFRNAVILHGNQRYAVGDAGVDEISVKQVQPDVVAMVFSLKAGFKVESRDFDAARGGYLFFTGRTVGEAEPPKGPFEIEADEELARFRERLSKDRHHPKKKIRRVVIDPGHGGFDSGAVGPTGLKEKDVVLDIARRVKSIIDKETGMYAFLTRRGDYYIPLSSRTVIANKYRADLFVSIHANANENRKARGYEVYFCSEKASSKEAEAVAQRENISYEERDESSLEKNLINIEEIVFKAGRKKLWDDSREACDNFIALFPGDLGVKSRGAHSANFFVLRKARMPSVLVEVAFISNPEEERILGSEAFKERMAREIVKVIRSLKIQ